MKTYLAGPMTGYVDFNYPLFIQVTAYLREKEYDIVSPVECVNNIEGTEPYEDCLRKDLKVLLDCERIYLLPEWKRSKGATLEVLIAAVLQFPMAEVRPNPAKEGAFDVWPLQMTVPFAILALCDAYLPGWLRQLKVST